MSEHTAENEAPLTELQALALAEARDGIDWFAHQRTLTSLQRRGLVCDGQITTTGRAALSAAAERWPALLRVIPPESGQ